MHGIGDTTDIELLLLQGARVEMPGGCFIMGWPGRCGIVRFGTRTVTEYGHETRIDTPGGMDKALSRLRVMAAAEQGRIIDVDATTTLSELLERGATVHFPDGGWIRFDPAYGVFDVGNTEGADGCRDADRPGALTDALADLERLTNMCEPIDEPYADCGCC